MTLLEAVIAFVLLSLVGIVCLDQSRGASQLQRSSAEWNRAIAQGDAAMAAAVSGAPDVAVDGTSSGATAASAGAARADVARQPWRHGLDEVRVTVPMAQGRSYVISRLVPSIDRASRSRSNPTVMR